VQVVNVGESSAHSNVAPASLAVKLKPAAVEADAFEGLAVIVVSGGVVSAVAKLQLTAFVNGVPSVARIVAARFAV
jgi:hypothetical protein